MTHLRRLRLLGLLDGFDFGSGDVFAVDAVEAVFGAASTGSHPL
jgi:hypothetical protein